MKTPFAHPLPRNLSGLIVTLLLSSSDTITGVAADKMRIAIPHTLARFDPDWQGTKYEPKGIVSSPCALKVFPYVVQGEFGRALVLEVQTCGGDDVITVRNIRVVIDGDDSPAPIEMGPDRENELRLDNQKDVSLKELVPRIGESHSARAVVETNSGTLPYRFTRRDRRIFSRMWTLYKQDQLPQDEMGRAAWLKEHGPYFAGFEGVSEPTVVQSSRHLPTPPAGSGESGPHEFILQLLVLKDGRVGEVRLLKSTSTSPEFAEAAVVAVREWRFDPALREKKPVDAYYTVTVDIP